jgi:prepilin-type N-terminal cleavage/methylation domain-containing protein
LIRRRGRQGGFTLLEVMIALTICAIALASLFRVISGSKQLTFRARGALTETVELRNLLSLPLLADEQGEPLVSDDDSKYRIEIVPDELEVPDRKTDVTTETLYEYEIKNDDGDVVLRGSYWVTLDVAE